LQQKKKTEDSRRQQKTAEDRAADRAAEEFQCSREVPVPAAEEFQFQQAAEGLQEVAAPGQVRCRQD
jgi:hypothetical protein